MAGIDKEVKIVKRTGNGKTFVTFRKWELISTHTARRTGVTWMYLATKDGGMRMDDIKAMIGHTHDGQTNDYVRANPSEIAAKLGSNPFFD